MRYLIVTAILGVALLPQMTQAQTNTGNAQPNATTAPSAGNSGTGISGAAGGKNGPAASSDTTSGSNTQSNPTVQQQDSANVKGLPGGKSGPAVKPEDRR
jgi:hypothetical protein